MMDVTNEREVVEMLTELIRTATTKKQFIQLIEPAEWVLNTYLPGFSPDFKQRAAAKPKETLSSLAYIFTRFLEDTEQMHYLTDVLNLPMLEAEEVETKVAKNTKRRI
jgi:hypothetical protein